MSFVSDPRTHAPSTAVTLPPCLSPPELEAALYLLDLDLQRIAGRDRFERATLRRARLHALKHGQE